MSREVYFEKVEKVRYSCHSCGHPLPEYGDKEWFPIVNGDERLDFHLSCLWKHLKETWVPYETE